MFAVDGSIVLADGLVEVHAHPLPLRDVRAPDEPHDAFGKAFALRAHAADEDPGADRRERHPRPRPRHDTGWHRTLRDCERLRRESERKRERGTMMMVNVMRMMTMMIITMAMVVMTMVMMTIVMMVMMTTTKVVIMVIVIMTMMMVKMTTTAMMIIQPMMVTMTMEKMMMATTMMTTMVMNRMVMILVMLMMATMAMSCHAVGGQLGGGSVRMSQSARRASHGAAKEREQTYGTSTMA